MKKLSLFLIIFFSYITVSAQNVSIDLGADEIGENQAFTITLTVHNQRLSSYSAFPEIEGFVKRGTSSSSSTNFINGQRSSTMSIIQNYVATGQGQFRLPPFAMKVNGQEVRSPGTTIKVGPPIQRRQRRYDPFGMDPFEDFFGQRQSQQPKEFVDVEADAFFALTTDKSSVYVGEGFTLTLALYVSQRNQAEMKWYDINTQINEITKKIKPTNCWEENFAIESITTERVEINGVMYNQYKLYQSAYYPLNTEPISFPSTDLKMIKYKVAKQRTFYGRNKQEEFTTFTSKPKSVEVKELPDHPLKESVSVGNYRLDEKISKKQLNTGESFNYNFTIQGEGNISAIKDLEIVSDENFDLYPPNVQQHIGRGNGRVRGRKSFSFYGIPNEPGQFDMSEYFNWIYFNTRTERYDTLRSELILNVTGESKKNEYILSNDMGTFYDSIELKDNSFFSLRERETMRTIINIIIFAMLGTVVAFMFKK